MIREGDVYTYNLPSGKVERIRACYRPFIVVESENEMVTAVPLTTNVSHYIDNKCVYTTMTVNNSTKNICILTDISVRIPKKELVKKIAHVDKDVYEQIKEKMHSVSFEEPIINEKSNSSQPEGIILEEGQDIKEIRRILEGMNSKRYIRKERIISFFLGIIASVVAAVFYELVVVQHFLSSL